MASKYVNLEAAAAQLSISTEELNRLRESGQIRGFADRGTWKFKVEDVEALGRTLPSDSNPEMPHLDEADDDYFTLDDDLDLAGGSQIVLEEEMGDQPTVISKKSPHLPPNSDSDVRLVIDPSLESDAWLTSPATRGDSAPRQQNPQTPLRATSEDDSKVSLNEPQEGWSSISDSDVRLSPLDDAGSDITLAADSGIDAGGKKPSTPSDMTDSELKLADDMDLPGVGSGIIGAGSDITLMPDDSGPRLMDVEEDEESVLNDIGPGSGLAFSPGESGISLDLAGDSGISLEPMGDSALIGPDSGISLVPDSGIGLTLDDRYERDEDEIGGATIPMMGTIGEDENDTSFDMPLLDDSSADLDSTGETTSVVMFDDDDSVEDTMEFDSAELSDDEFVDFDSDGDSYDELSDGDLDVSDDMLEDDVLEADDDAFEDDFESGESVSALPVPGGMRGAAAVPVAAEWDMLSFSLVVVSTLFMGICTLLMYDLVRTMWGYETPLGVNGIILDTLQGIIKS